MKYKLEYAGAKPLISQHGVQFDHTKKDRYELLKIVACLIDKLHNTKSSTYINFSCVDSEYDDNKVLSILKKYIDNLDESIESEIDEFLQKEKKEKRHIKSMQISQIDKDVWLKNIELMHKTNLQRVINKVVYHKAIEFLSKELVDHHIKKLIIPMTKRYHHVLKSLKNIFEKLFTGIKIVSVIKKSGDELMLEFQVINSWLSN